MRLRRYCWRTGIVVELDDDEKCPECSFRNHKPTPRQDLCGCFAPVAGGAGSGEPCIRPINHDGPHVGHTILMRALAGIDHQLDAKTVFGQSRREARRNNIQALNDLQLTKEETE